MRPPLSLLRLALRNHAFPSPSHWVRPFSSSSTSTAAAGASRQPSDRVVSIVDDVSNLTLLEVDELIHLLGVRLEVDQKPMLGIVSAGMSIPASAGVAAGPVGAEEAKEEKKEKTAFDVKLEGFDAAAKIKVIKEIRGFTSLGLKEAKDLVEKAPVVVKSGIAKEEAEKIMEKLKEIGAKVTVE